MRRCGVMEGSARATFPSMLVASGSRVEITNNPAETASGRDDASKHLDRVGIRGNLFELGGDSTLSIRMVAKAAELGVKISQDAHRFQTIEELAEAADIDVTTADNRS